MKITDGMRFRLMLMEFTQTPEQMKQDIDGRIESLKKSTRS